MCAKSLTVITKYIFFLSRFLKHTGFIVFLNKQDLLKEKLDSGKSIAKYFPEYEQYSLSEKDGNPFDEFDRTRFFIRHQLIVSIYILKLHNH